MGGLKIVSPRPRNSEQVCSIVSGQLFSIPRNLLKDLLNRASDMSVVFIFDICSVYEIAAMIGCIDSIEVK